MLLARTLPYVALAVLGSTVAGCGTSDAPDGESAAASGVQPVGDTWGPLVGLRDDSNAFPDGKPAGGWFVAPIHATLLPTGKVLITGWGRRDEHHCMAHGTRLNGTSFVLDPASALAGGTLRITPIGEDPAPGTKDVLYCSGQVPLPDGRILYTGGSRYQNLGEPNQIELGLDYARIFSPADKTFHRVVAPMLGGAPGMPGMAWYPTNTRLANGKVLVIGGFSRCCDGNFANRTLQLFDPAAEGGGANPWTVVSSHADTWQDVAPGLRDYVHTFLLPRALTVDGLARDIATIGANGRVVLASTAPGPTPRPRFWTAGSGARPGNAGAWDSTAALVSTGEIMTMGGTDNNQVAQRIDLYNPETSAWRSVDTGIGRRNPSSVLLPDGTFLLVNGGTDDRSFTGDRRRAQIVDPAAGSVTTLAPWTNDPDERGYHNFAVLLKDGRVLIGGGISPMGGIGCERPDLRIYNPPYFAKGQRPLVGGIAEPVAVKVGGPAVTLSFSGEPLKQRGGVVLMATGAQTHSFDENQRYVPLTFTQSGGSVTFTPPASAQAAPPGDYILYLVSAAGVPSVGVHVRLSPPDPAPTGVRRTVIFMRGQTVPGQDMFVRGGIDHDAMLRLRGVSCAKADGSPNLACAIPIVHRNLRNSTTAPWKQGDTLLDWYGAESGQTGVSHGITAAGTAADWTTNQATNPFRVAVDGFGFEPLNAVGDHLWMVDVDMDCSRAFPADGAAWFEVKSFIAGPGAPGWEADVNQSGTPYPSRNHFGKCGMVNTFERGSSAATIVPFP